ncbi:MAG: Cof-type HAD-IIB family hydrolase [Synergistaceae bacterium]|nr:Cof-type HAD-IIB family hydrolase [Synergistaceae bacterium]
MTSIRLIALDLDGTLLDSSLEISEDNKNAVRGAMELGVSVVINTGRMFRSSKAFVDQLSLTGPVICYNGAMICRPDGEVTFHEPLDIEVARGLLSIFRDRGIYVQSYVDDILNVRENDGETVWYVKTFGADWRLVGDALYSPVTAPTKLLAITDGIEQSHVIRDEMSELFGDKLYVTISNSNFVEMMNPAANKGRRLAHVARDMGIGMESVMALGDGENDIEMVSCAGIGIAMGNGLEKIKSAACDIAPANDEDGVAWAIRKYVLEA